MGDSRADGETQRSLSDTHEAGETRAAEIRRVMDTVRRRDFLPEEQRPFADEDRPLPIGFGQTNSQPTTVLRMLTLLDVSAGQRVLDLGCGSGWTTAILARLVGDTGEVIGVERIPELIAPARRALESQDVPWARIEQSERGVLGLPEESPFDRILVSAGADELPVELLDQLSPTGVLVVPVRSTMRRLRKDASGSIEDTEHGRYSFVPLIRDDAGSDRPTDRA